MIEEIVKVFVMFFTPPQKLAGKHATKIGGQAQRHRGLIFLPQTYADRHRQLFTAEDAEILLLAADAPQ